MYPPRTSCSGSGQALLGSFIDPEHRLAFAWSRADSVNQEYYSSAFEAERISPELPNRGTLTLILFA